jgi:hypothetical protein
MKHSVKCLICNERKSVNGQRQITEFAKEHCKHEGLTVIQKITCNHIDLNNPQDRIDLKIDPKPLITHGHYNPNDKYLR